MFLINVDMNINQENKIKKIVLEYLERGRPGWDVPHTLACVHWMKELLKNENGNSKILIPVMYFHDIGYIDLIERNKNLDLKENMNLKEEHMRIGSIIARKILNEVGGFNDDEIDRICYLVSIHDNYEKIVDSKDDEAQLVYEADGLGQIDRERVKPTYSKSDTEIFLRDFKNKRGVRFKTENGRRIYLTLLKKAEEYSED